MTNNYPISVWLTESNARFLHCMVCGMRLPTQLEGLPQTLIVGGDMNLDNTKPLKFPIKIFCKTRSNKYGDCPARYIIQGYIYSDKEEE